MEHDAKDNIWVIADSLDLDSLNSELKKGKPLSLENLKKWNLILCTANILWMRLIVMK